MSFDEIIFNDDYDNDATDGSEFTHAERVIRDIDTTVLKRMVPRRRNRGAVATPDELLHLMCDTAEAHDWLPYPWFVGEAVEVGELITA
ncbi:MAG: hypothetical protein GC159_06555 [Phycisphaera sp.]|nr:hypothetical protein [Phycisphaera sp.]